MALTKYFVILLFVYLNFDISPIHPAAIRERSDSDVFNKEDDTSTVNPETYSPTLTNDDDIEKIFESYENQYIKNSNWFNDDAALKDLKESEMISNKLKPMKIKPEDDSTLRGLETDTTVDDVVESVHNIVDEKIETKSNRTDRTIVVVVTTNVFNVNGSDDAGKRQHTSLSFGTPGMIQKETSTDPTITWHNKITTEFFNSKPSPITSPSETVDTNNEGKFIDNIRETTEFNEQNHFESESEPEDEKDIVISTTEKSNEKGGHDFNDIVNDIDIRQLPETVNTISDYKPAIAGRNFDEVLPNDNSNDILRIMKIIPSRSEGEINSGSLSKPFEIPAQEPDSSLMEAIENILDTDVRKAFERDIPETRHVPLDINIEEEALYAPLKDLSEYIVEEIPINANYDLPKENYRSDDDTMKKVEVMERLDEKALEKYMDKYQDKEKSSLKPFEMLDYFHLEPMIRHSDEELPSPTATVDATTKTTTTDTATKTTTADTTTITADKTAITAAEDITTTVDESKTFQPTERQIEEQVPDENKGAMTTLQDNFEEITETAGHIQDKTEPSDNHEEIVRDEKHEEDELPKEEIRSIEKSEKDVISEQAETSARSVEQEINDEDKTSENDKMSKTNDLLETEEIVNIEKGKISETTDIPEEFKTSESTESLDTDDHFSTEPPLKQDEIIPSLSSIETERRFRQTDDEEGQFGAENIINLGNYFYVPINDSIYDDPDLTTITPIPPNDKPTFIPRVDVDDIINRGNNTFIEDLLSYDENATLLRDIEFINERDERFRDFRLKFAEEILLSETRIFGIPVTYLTQDNAIEILRKNRKQRQYILDMVDDFERNTEIKYEDNLLDLLELYTNRDQDEVPYTLLTIMNRFSHLKNERSNVVSAMNNYVAKLMRLTLSDGGKKLFKLDYDEILEKSDGNKEHIESERLSENAGTDKIGHENISEGKRPATMKPDTEDVVSEVVMADEETTEQHQIIKKPGVDGAGNDDVEIKAIKVVSNELLPTQSPHFESRSFSDDDEPVDPLRTLVEGVELTAELTKTVDNFQSFTDPNSSIHHAANQVVENKEYMELVKNAEELNSTEDSIWCGTARYVFVAGGVLLIGLIVLLGVFSVLRFRQFKRNILFSC